jgi:MFS family permease
MASRVLGGAAQGFLGASVMTYLSEMAITQVRGALLGAFAMSFALGQFYIAMGLQIVFIVSRKSDKRANSSRDQTAPLSHRNALFSQ